MFSYQIHYRLVNHNIQAKTKQNSEPRMAIPKGEHTGFCIVVGEATISIKHVS